MLGITVIEESLMLFQILEGVNDEHPEKALFPFSVTEEGIVICVNDEHPLKA